MNDIVESSIKIFKEGFAKNREASSASERSGSNDLLCAEIEHYLTLKDDWDSYGAKPIDKRAIDIAKNLARSIDLDLQAVPTPTGGVQLEYHNGNVDVEIDISVDDV